MLPLDSAIGVEAQRSKSRAQIFMTHSPFKTMVSPERNDSEPRKTLLMKAPTQSWQLHSVRPAFARFFNVRSIMRRQSCSKNSSSECSGASSSTLRGSGFLFSSIAVSTRIPSSYVLGTFCYLCVRNGHLDSGGGRGIRSFGPLAPSITYTFYNMPQRPERAKRQAVATYWLRGFLPSTIGSRIAFKTAFSLSNCFH
jgi:hypothetical protein